MLYLERRSLRRTLRRFLETKASSEEVRRLQETVHRVAIVLENIYSLEQLKEQTRLAALGTMAAGLAHEIRNPLGGIEIYAGLIADDLPERIEER